MFKDGNIPNTNALQKQRQHKTRILKKMKTDMNKLATSQNLFKHIKNLIEQTKQTVAVAVNSSMTLMYWNIGKTINDEILQNLLILKLENENEKIFLENK